jgi:hypothetical protein
MASPPFDDVLSNLNPQFAGLFQRLSPDKEEDVPSAAEVVDDYEGEQETLDLQNGTGDNHGEDDADDNDNEDSEEDAEEDTVDEASVGFSGLKDVVKNASKGVTEGTDGEYRRYIHLSCWSASDVRSDGWLLAKLPSALSSCLQISSSMVVSRSLVQRHVPMHHFLLRRGLWMGM